MALAENCEAVESIGMAIESIKFTISAWNWYYVVVSAVTILKENNKASL